MSYSNQPRGLRHRFYFQVRRRESLSGSGSQKNFVRRAPSGRATSKERRRPEEAAIRPARFVWIEAKHKRAGRGKLLQAPLCPSRDSLLSADVGMRSGPKTDLNQAQPKDYINGDNVKLLNTMRLANEMQYAASKESLLSREDSPSRSKWEREGQTFK